MRPQIKRCDVDEHMRLLRVFGGPGVGESQEAKGRRHQCQIELHEAWPELHEALMAMIGLDRTGAPLSGGADRNTT